MDPIHPFGEPDIGVSSVGNVFVSGPTGTGTQRSFWEGSVDGGQTFRLICPTNSPPPSAAQGCNSPPGGGDTDIAFDRHSPQKQYFSDLYALLCFRTATTNNEGVTATPAATPYPNGCAGTPPIVDRQWWAVYDPSAGTPNQSAYTGSRPLVYNEYGPAPSTWIKSNDGLNFTVADHGRGHFGADGYPAIDQVTGKVFEATYSGGNILLNIGTPQSNGDLCFLDSTNAETGLGGTCPSGTGLITVTNSVINSGDVANFVVSSMDSKRNLYVVWVGRSANPAQRQVFVSAASAASGWTNWTTPIQVSDGAAASGDAVNVFPWIKAGEAGRADAVWYGDATLQDPSSPNSTHVWNVFMSPIVYPTDGTGAITGNPVSLTLAKVTPHPMDYLDICLSGTGCITNKGNRNLADFFYITMGNDGAAEIVYDDMSNGLIQTGPMAPSTPADHAGAAVVTVARQNGGVGLLGTPVTGPSSAPVTFLNDQTKDALYPVMGGTNQPAFDILRSEMSLSGTTLTVTLKVADLTQITAGALATGGATPATNLSYVTRWQMGKTLYYAEMYGTTANLALSLSSAQFSAGKTQSIDLCSVSACDPHVLTYPEVNPPDTMPETGSATCPPSPGIGNPCTITMNVNTAHVGSPTASSLLEEVGAYAFSAMHTHQATTNPQAQADNVPLEVDGVCCYNFQAGFTAVIPEFPLPGLAVLVAGAALVAGTAVVSVRARRRRQRQGRGLIG
jgi:hypothetical protein